MKKIILLCLMFFCFIQFGFAQAGELDSSFGNKGIVTTDFNFLLDTTYRSDCKQVLVDARGSLYAIIQQQDGDKFSFISKRLPDGSQI